MNTRLIASEYRLSHWAQIIRERKESGLTVTAFCEKAGFHENIYYYWQRKLREAACEELSKKQNESRGLVTQRFTEVKLYEQPEQKPFSKIAPQMRIEAAGIHINIDSSYPVDKLVLLIRELMRPC